MAALEVDSVDMYPLDNARDHHTDLFEILQKKDPTPVLRRGQKFSVTIRFNNRGDKNYSDNVMLDFSFRTQYKYTKPNVVHGSRGVVSLSKDKIITDDRGGAKWNVWIKRFDEKQLTLEVQSPTQAPVGEWTLRVKTSLAASQPGDVRTYDHPKKFFLLFNPWNKDDAVYMAEERLLDEYVLNNVGKVWMEYFGRQWVFGQFDEVVLPATMLLLEKANLSPANRGDPVLVTRAISKMVNSNDDDGVLSGRWDGDYSDGTHPSAWTGSVAILKQYLDTGKKVRYGQCWVFAAVVTTVCRALGIPSRAVTNISSAHDTNATMTIDKYYSATTGKFLRYDPYNYKDDEGKPEDERRSHHDSIWNFHVWNDVWMARPDLPVGFGGWQAIDATPQEPSDGMYQCGPASLEAIRKGFVGFRYDISFILAEVNADVVHWMKDTSAPLGYSIIESNTYEVGQKILTKKPFVYDPNGETDTEDITNQYKFEEGSEKERLSLYNAIRNTEIGKRFYNVPDADKSKVTFHLVEKDKISIGESFDIAIKITNDSDEVRTVQSALSANSVFYNGVKAHIIKEEESEITVQPKSTVQQVLLTVGPDDYLDKLVEYCFLKIFTICKVKETRQTWAADDDFRIVTPNLKVIVPEIATVDRSTPVIFKFNNPLNKQLTNCKFTYEGPGVAKVKTVQYRDVGPKEEVLIEDMFTPYQTGEHKIVATFISKQLLDVTGSAVLNITK